MSDRSNEYNLDDDVHLAVAILEAAQTDAKIKELQAELDWFKKSFRKMFYKGTKGEDGHKGSMVKVTSPNDPAPQLDTDLLKKLFPVKSRPEYYKQDKFGEVKEFEPRAQSVTFSLLEVAE